MGRETKCRNVQTNVFKSLVCYCKFFFHLEPVISTSQIHKFASLLSGRSRGAVKEQMGEGSCKVVLLLAGVCVFYRRVLGCENQGERAPLT